MIEIMNEGTVKDLPRLFYYQHKAEKHHYAADDMSDVDADTELELSFDFGGRYSCMTVSQEHNEEERILHEFDTNQITEDERKTGKVLKLPDIVRGFHIKFDRKMRNRRLRIWGDRTGLNQREDDSHTLFDQIRAILEDLGWTVEVMATYGDSGLHKSRYTFMNTIFEEAIDDYPRIRINAYTCPNLVVSLDTTRVTDEFKKDKKDERNASFNQSYAPHLTDTLDYKLFNKYRYLLDDEYEYGGYSGIDGGLENL